VLTATDLTIRRNHVRRDSDSATPVPLDEEHARKITLRISLLLGTFLDQRDKLVVLINEARDGDAHLALGYRSWTEYMSTEFSGLLPRLSIEDRTTLVADLTAAGMSTRAIAPIVGVTRQQVSNDRKVASDLPPEPDGPVPADAPRPAVTGIDGKTYNIQAPQPRTTVRRSLPDAFQIALEHLQGSVELMEMVLRDARFQESRLALSVEYISTLTNYAHRVQDLEDMLRSGQCVGDLGRGLR
jgi:hypothetical protein